MTVEITESVGTLERTNTPGRMLITIITAGQGSSGNYPAETIKNAVERGLWSKGTLMYGNHMTPDEAAQRPEGDIWNAIGKLSEGAYWNQDIQGAQAEVEIYPSVKDVVFERAQDMGISIRGGGRIDESGTVTELTSIESVDLVTKAGRGGSVVKLIESARRDIAERNGLEYRPRHGTKVTEATDNDVRRILSQAVVNTHRDDESGWVDLDDFDDTYVYYSRRTPEGGRGHYRQRYNRDGVNVALAGEPERVEQETTYTPTRPEPDNPVNEARKGTTATAGGNMVEITESQHAELREKADKVPELERAVQEAEQRAVKAETELAEARQEQVKATAETIVNEAFEGIEAPGTRADLIEKATGRPDEFDTEKFKELAEARAAEFTGGTQRIDGFGDTAPVNESKSDFDYDNARKNIYEGGR